MDPITLNKIGTPPASRHVQQRRVEMEAEMAARGERPWVSRRWLDVSIIAGGAVLGLGLLVAWLAR